MFILLINTCRQSIGIEKRIISPLFSKKFPRDTFDRKSLMFLFEKVDLFVQLRWVTFGKMWKNMENQPFFCACMAKFGKYYYKKRRGGSMRATILP